MLVSLAAAAALLPLPGLSAQEGRLAGLDAYVAGAMAEWRVPGLALAVVVGDSVVHARGYGVKQVGRPEPVNVTTVFQVGSTSKAFTAAAAGALVEEGRLGWDDPVVAHLPWFRLSDPWVTASVTLRDLLVHRVGLDGWAHNVTPWPAEEVVRRVRHVPFAIPFRSDHLYSNVMFGTAGLVVGAAAGTTWDDALRVRLFEPLGMTATDTDPYVHWQPGAVADCFDCEIDGPADLGRAVPGADVAMPHMRYGDSVVAIPWRSYAGAAGAGAVNSNAVDLARWVRMLLRRGELDGRRILAPETIDTLLAPHIARPPRLAAAPPDAPPNFAAYGFGWRLDAFRGRRLVWHTGGIWGFLAYVAVMPEEDIGVVVLANRDSFIQPHGSLLPFAVGTWIFDRLLGHDPGDPSRHLLSEAERAIGPWEQNRRALYDGRITGTAPPYPLERYAGTYADSALGSVGVRVRGGALDLAFPGGATARIEHWHHDLFRARFGGPRRFEAFVRFDDDGAGSIRRMRIERLADFDRIADP